MTNVDFILSGLAVVVIIVVVMAVIVLAASPVTERTISAECTLDIPLWKMHSCNKIGVCEDTFYRMTVEEARGACR